MTEQEVKLVIGGLLHDIGKVIYRTGDRRNHSKSGYDYLKEEIKIEDKEILESVLYHHASNIRSSNIQPNSYAYITYISDNIASAVDRRNSEEAIDYGFEKSLPLQPVFNIIKGNHENKYYKPMMLQNEINEPLDEKKPFEKSFYNEVKNKITECLHSLEWNEHYINSLLSVLESTLSYVPSSTSKKEIADISLYDHVKITAAINSCIYQYLKENNINDYKKELFTREKKFYDKKAFLLYSIDISGIQKFIYTIHSKDALKTLRARSFYIQIMMEHIMDCLLDKIGLSRANIIYSGGGHCYILLPNTTNVKNILDKYEKELNSWFRKHHDVSLYFASAYIETSANTLKNVPENSYEQLFLSINNKINDKKANPYSADEIIQLNSIKKQSYSQECRVCKGLEQVNDDGLCKFCDLIKRFSKDILYEPFFVILNDKNEKGIPLPNGYVMIAESEENLQKRLKGKDNSFIRAYSKNKFYIGLNIATKIWVGNYTNGQTFEELANLSTGINRIGVLKADVDNLEEYFVQGFEAKYNTLSRTATFSRHLSLFFQHYINNILENGSFKLSENKTGKRNATIIYSGGDDILLVGAWDEVISISLDIKNALSRYTQNTLTLSAGIGVYNPSYPINLIAFEVSKLEETSKSMPNKKSITIFKDGEKHWEQGEEFRVNISNGTYYLDEFENKVIGEKFNALKKFFESSEDKGMNFMYNLLELIHERKNKINFARYVYLLARMEPKEDSSLLEKENYNEFSQKMYNWIKSEKDCRELITAMNIYSYIQRNNEKEEK